MKTLKELFKKKNKNKTPEEMFSNIDEVFLFNESGRYIAEGEGKELRLFLFLLMRDHLTPGVVADIIKQATKTDEKIAVSNGWLMRYAEWIAGRLGL